MLFVYGPFLPVRILEEIRFWKQQEAEHTEVIQAIVPSLEADYVKLLEEWKPIFERTEAAADKLLQYALATPHAATSHEVIRQTERLLRASCQQSQEFIRHLEYMLKHSAAVKSVPLAPVVLLHIIRESAYFLEVLERLNRPGEIAGSMAAAPPYPDPYHAAGAQPFYREEEAQELAAPPTSEHPELTDDASPAITDELNRFETSEVANPPEEPDGIETADISEASLEVEAEQEHKQEEQEQDELSLRQEPSADDNTETTTARVPERSVPIGGHTLPPLPYPYNALEPYIDEQTMRIHHDKHHKTYVDDLNKAELKLQDARKSGNFDLVKHWERELAFNGAGHYLHTIFWDIMNPKGGGKPQGELLEQIKRDFGSYDAFHKQFSEAAAKVEGGGWAILVWSPRAHRLEILTAEKHQNLSQWDVIPLLPLDVWEHAYYLKHQNARANYIKDWWNVVYWPAVTKRYEAAKKLKWQPF
ncbi:Fe-Mn family superoxide dismutase [Paenibacillus barengoltzii]|uniref:superoxide dismutase n=1 Tax=Paenibacillus barengoltzii G22 TaxID=1235795 RepID=R9L7E5_9BACL|nr:Fe-Mn family superoxide dismutase [Paenibacillus barengoltzii]EOS54724.1 Fe-Mn family superoxide dismutase [Paenibacillus barengoltzii G22]